MKKLILFLLLLLPIPALAQVSTTTPNLGLTKPCVAGDPGCAPSGDPNWGPKINGNFDILDARVPKPTPARVTVGTKPSSPVLNEIVVVTDGLAATDCNVAGGTNNVTCQWTGTAWVPVGGGTSGGGGGATTFGSITSGSNTTATMVVGSGASLAPSGTGTITATAVPLTGVTGATSLVKNNQANTYTTGDQNLAAATSFTFPVATGAAPTGSGRCAYDSTANRLKCGFNGTTVTVAVTSEIQPLSTLLTAFASLSTAPPAAGQIPYFTSATGIALATAVLCPDTGGQHTNVTNTNPLTFSCGTSGGGSISGLTIGNIPKAASPTSLTPSLISEAAGVVTVAGGFSNCPAPPCLVVDPSAITTTDKTWIAMNQSGTVRLSTGVFTSGNIVKTDANGLLVDGGAAGTGTWTDSSTNTGTNKTFVATEAGGTNTITVGIAPYWDAASLTLPSGSTCTLGAITQINGGPSLNPVNCTNASSSTFEGNLTLRQAVTTVTFTATVNDVDSSSHHFAGDFSAMCRNNNTTVNSTWGTAQSVDITMTTANNNYTGTTSAVTPNGTCSAGATLFWRWVRNASFTDDGDARLIGILMKQAS